ncbi:hypothetical protein EX011_21600 [Salmonella enterica]|nr:hypothetical protein [Salmonella enterica]EJF7575697.1 type II toxin-antitoxin system Phd/YefM family antitoxin [Salmonella enterica subsp. enterica]HAV7961499.1 hypothetical protein [Escherichia coli]
MKRLAVTEARKQLYALCKEAHGGQEVVLSVRGVGNVALVAAEELQALRQAKFQRELDDVLSMYDDQIKELADR